jgi:hypothetical protein
VALISIPLAGAAFLFFRTHRGSPAIVSGSTSDLLNQLPSDAPVIGFIDLAALRSTPIAAEVEAMAPQALEDHDYQDFMRGTGFDYTRDLDRVAIAAWPAGDGRQGPNKILALPEGRFDRQKITAYALRFGRSVRETDHQVLEIPGDSRTGPISLTFLSPSQIALTSAKKVEVALAQGGLRPDPKMQTRTARVGSAPIFAIAGIDNLPREFRLNLGKFDQLRELLEGVRAIAIAGRPQGANFDVGAEADCDSTLHAIQLATLLDGLRMFGRAALSGQKARRQMTAEQAALLDTLLRAASVSHDSHWIRINLKITPAMLQSALPSHADRRSAQ